MQSGHSSAGHSSMCRCAWPLLMRCGNQRTRQSACEAQRRRTPTTPAHTSAERTAQSAATSQSRCRARDPSCSSARMKASITSRPDAADLGGRRTEEGGQGRARQLAHAWQAMRVGTAQTSKLEDSSHAYRRHAGNLARRRTSATMTAVMCSTALPARGSNTTDRNSVVRPEDVAMSWIESVMHLREALALSNCPARSSQQAVVRGPAAARTLMRPRR